MTLGGHPTRVGRLRPRDLGMFGRFGEKYYFVRRILVRVTTEFEDGTAAEWEKSEDRAERAACVSLVMRMARLQAGETRLPGPTGRAMAEPT
jgi:hypothetical protein